METYRITEGTIIEYKGVVWIAKGIRHPPRYAIAFPRYLEFSIPGIVRTSDCVPVPAPHIPLRDSKVYDPRYLLRKSNVAMKLVKEMEGFGCEFGLTGSLAIFGTGRDVDLVVFNEWCFEDLYFYLLELRMRGKIKGMWGKWDAIGKELAKWRFENSALEGILKGIPFSIKMVREPEPCRRPVKVKETTFRGIIRSINNFVFPYTYTINGMKVEALRLQFSELDNVFVEGKCDLEVWDSEEVCVLTKNSSLELKKTSK